MLPADEVPGGISWSAILAFFLLVATILAAGALFYQSQEQQIREQVANDLTTIATLKAGQIAQWREDRLYDARVISAGAFFTEGAGHYLAYGDEESRQKVLSRFVEMNESPQYQNVVLADPQGNVRISLDPAVKELNPLVKDEIAASLASGEAVLTDFHRMPASDHIHQDIIAPLRIREGNTTRPVGVVILSIDPNEFFYPYIQSWPVPSATAETLLVERDGDHVVFLNKVRHQPDTALNLTIPLTETDVPAVKAVLGTTGSFTGTDYRGVEVISVLEPVPNSPWYMVAKVDTAEAYAGWRSRSGIIIILVVGTLAGTAVIAGLLWQRRQKYYYRGLYTAESARREEEQRNRERLETLLTLAGMEQATEQELADFVLDAACRLTSSPLAFIGTMTPDESVFDITAWSKSVMQDCSVAASPIHYPIAKAGIWAEAVRQRKPIIVNDYPAPLPGKKGLPEGHVPVTRFVSVPIFEEERIVMVCAVANKDSDYTLLDVNNLTLLMQGVWSHLRKRKADEALRQKTTDLEAAYEEITASEEELKANYEELARSEQALKASEHRLRRFYDSGLFGVIFWNMDGKITDANDTFLAMTGYSREDLMAGRIDWGAMTPPEFHYLDERSVQELKTTGRNAVPFEKEYFRKNGSRLPVLIAGSMLDEKRYEGVAFVLDLSSLKETRVKLAAEQKRYRELFENVSVGISRSTPGPNARILAANPADLRIFGASSVEELLETPPENLYADPGDRIRFIDELTRNGSVTGMEIRFRTVKGRPFWGRISSRRYVEEDGSVYFDNTVEDITLQKAAIEDLRTSEERFRGVFDRSTAGKSLTSAPDGRLLRINQAFADMLGYSTEELQQVNWADITYPEDVPESRECIRCLLAGEQANYRMEKRYIHKTGRIVWADVSTSLLRDSAGNPLYLVTTILDITERKRAEEKIRASEQKLRDILNSTPFPVAIVDTEDNNILYWSRSAMEKFGHTAPTAAGWYELAYPDPAYRQDVVNRWKPFLETARASGQPVNTGEYRVTCHDGSVRICELYAMFLADNLIVTFNDITEKKNAEARLRETNEYLRNLIEYANAPIIVWDPAFRITRFNHAFENLTGRSEQEVLGQPLSILFPESSRGTSLDLIRQTLAGERWEIVEIPIQHISREVRIVLWNSANIVDPQGTIIATIAQGQDITDRKQNEVQREMLIKELEQKNAELERFTFTVSHDLKSPLITIRGFAGMIESDAGSGVTVQLRHDIQRIMSAAETMQALLADLLELSRVGKIANPAETLPFSTLAREAVDLLATPLAEKNVKVEIAREMPEVIVDHARIREVLVNLIENAIKFMGNQEQPVIRIGFRGERKDPVFFVQDNGMGINPHYLERIFNLFERLDVTRHGTGIGLPIARRIIEVHGGKIWAESEGEGKGTTFLFTLPGPAGAGVKESAGHAD